MAKVNGKKLTSSSYMILPAEERSDIIQQMSIGTASDAITSTT